MGGVSGNFGFTLAKLVEQWERPAKLLRACPSTMGLRAVRSGFLDEIGALPAPLGVLNVTFVCGGIGIG